MILLQAMSGVVTLLLIGIIGYVLGAKKWIDQNINMFCTKLITHITLPLFLIHSLMSTFTKGQLPEVASGIIVPIISLSIAHMSAIFISRVCNVSKSRRGIFLVSFTCSNTIFIGIPVNIALFGEEAIPYALFYYLANTIYFWTVGNYYLASDNSQYKMKLFSKETVKKVLTLPMVAIMFAFTLLFFSIRLPVAVLNSAKYVGAITTPLAIILIGYMLQTVSIRKLKINKDQVLALVGRFIISPLTIFIIVKFIPIPNLMFKVFVVQASLPVMMQAAILPTLYGGDTEFGTTSVAVSTLLSIITIPIIMLIVSYY